MKRTLSCLLILILIAALPLTALAANNADQWITPDPELWGQSRTAAKKLIPYKCTEITVNKLDALAAADAEVCGYPVNAFYEFTEKAPGKTYYVLNRISYMLPVETKLTADELNVWYDEFVYLVMNEYGDPTEYTATKATWELLNATIEVSIGSHKAYNGSSNKTVAVVFDVPVTEEGDTLAASAAKATAKPSKGTGKSAQMTVTPSAECKDYNHVGANWTAEYYLNGTKLKKDSQSVTLRVGDVIVVGAAMTENDTNPDTGYEENSHTVTQNDLDKGFKVSFTVKVTENGGRYRDSEAKWKVTFTFTK